MSRWTRVIDPEALEQALNLAEGTYQQAILKGEHSVSGSTLSSGARSKWGGRYASSREKLFEKMRAAGIQFSLEKLDGGMILVLGAKATTDYHRGAKIRFKFPKMRVSDWLVTVGKTRSVLIRLGDDPMWDDTICLSVGQIDHETRVGKIYKTDKVRPTDRWVDEKLDAGLIPYRAFTLTPEEFLEFKGLVLAASMGLR